MWVCGKGGGGAGAHVRLRRNYFGVTDAAIMKQISQAVAKTNCWSESEVVLSSGTPAKVWRKQMGRWHRWTGRGRNHGRPMGKTFRHTRTLPGVS